MSADEQIALQFDVAQVPKSRRSRVWMDALNEFFYDYDYDLPNGIEVGEFTGGRAKDLSVASIKSDAMSVFRTASHITRDAIDAYFVLLPTDHPISLGQRRREVSLTRNQFALVSTSDTYAYIQNDTTVFNNLIIPGPLMRQYAPQVDDLVARAAADDPLSKAFFEMSSSLCAGFNRMAPRGRDLLCGQVVELLGVILDGADHQSAATPVRQAHYRRMMHIINREFADPGLNVGMIAARLNLSPRYLQEIAAFYETPIAREIRNRRIDEACRMLQNWPKTLIKEVAYRVGFRELAHFSRAFKARTGVSASSYGS